MDPAPQIAPRMCAKHGIVRDPFGHCVICRREDVEADADPGGARKALAALVALGVVVSAVLFYKGASGRPAPPPVVLAAPAPSTSPEQAPALAEPDLDARREEARAAADSREAADRKARLERQMKQVPIRVYTAHKCDLCRTATGFLQQKGFAFDELDVDANADDLAALRKLNPENTVPTIVVGEEVLVGFGPGVVLGAIYRAAEKRVR